MGPNEKWAADRGWGSASPSGAPNYHQTSRPRDRPALFRRHRPARQSVHQGAARPIHRVSAPAAQGLQCSGSLPPIVMVSRKYGVPVTSYAASPSHRYFNAPRFHRLVTMYVTYQSIFHCTRRIQEREGECKNVGESEDTQILNQDSEDNGGN